MAHLWLSVEVVSGCTMLFGSRIINCSQVKSLETLSSQSEEDKFSASDFFFFFFFFICHPCLLCD